MNIIKEKSGLPDEKERRFEVVSASLSQQRSKSGI